VKQRSLFRNALFTAFLLLSLVLGGCQAINPYDVQPVDVYTTLKVSSPNCDYGGEFRSIEALDRYTVKFTLCYPDAALPSKLAFPTFSIQDAEYLYEKGGDSAALSLETNGTGPYMVEEWVPGTSLKLTANPNYWGVPPRSETLTLRWNPSSVYRRSELLFDRADGIDRPDLNSAIFKGNPNYITYTRPALSIAFLGINRDVPPYNDSRVRLGMAMLIDRQRVVANSFPAGAEAAEQFLPRSLTPGHSDVLRWHDYNIKEGTDLLNAAGFNYDQELFLYYTDTSTSYLPSPILVAQEIQAQLADAGLKITTVRMEEREFNAAVEAGELGLFLTGLSAEYPDATNFYDPNFSASSQRYGTPYGDISAALLNAKATSDAKSRQYYYDIVNQKLKEYILIIPLAHANDSAVFQADVTNVIISPLNENFDQMSTPDDQLTFMLESEPTFLWPADETSNDTMRVARLLYTPLVTYAYGSAELAPGLAEYWESNAALTEWTFSLRYGVTFSNGAELDANDVVATLGAQWNAKDPNHVGRTGSFIYFKRFFGEFINVGK